MKEMGGGGRTRERERERKEEDGREQNRTLILVDCSHEMGGERKGRRQSPLFYVPEAPIIHENPLQTPVKRW